MAIFIPGQSCSLCGGPVRSPSEAETFPAFVADRADPLFVFSDAVVHASCCKKHPLGAEAVKWRGETLRHRPPYVCRACGLPIADPDDFLCTGLLTRKSDDPRFEFNFGLLHRSHAESWPRLRELRRLTDLRDPH